ncbi:hypothetical protein TSAR_000557, partial [Trichomalopsis sarcophagae]
MTLLKSPNDQVLSCARANASRYSPSGLAVTDWPFSLSTLKVTLKIRGRGSCQSKNDYKITPNPIGLKPRIALSIRDYESQMMEKRSLNLLII